MSETSGCPSVCLMMDDRWGAIENHCEGEALHEGEHFHDLGATMPRARLVWRDEAPGVGPEHGREDE